MRGINKVMLIGGVGKDPEVRYTPSGAPVASLSLATDDSYKDRNTGEQVKVTDWHNIVVFGKLAEIVQQYVKKGSRLYVEGKQKTRKWQDRDSGQNRYITEVVVDINGTLQMLDSRTDGNPQRSQPANDNAPQQPQSQPQADAGDSGQYGNWNPDHPF